MPAIQAQHTAGMHPVQLAYAYAKARHDQIQEECDRLIDAIDSPQSDAPEDEWRPFYALVDTIAQSNGLPDARATLKQAGDALLAWGHEQAKRASLYQSNHADIEALYAMAERRADVRQKLIALAFKIHA